MSYALLKIPSIFTIFNGIYTFCFPDFELHSNLRGKDSRLVCITYSPYGYAPAVIIQSLNLTIASMAGACFYIISPLNQKKYRLTKNIGMEIAKLKKQQAALWPSSQSAWCINLMIRGLKIK
ncbi:hypothetical protein ACFPVS_08230 [Neisseria weixii]|uniref:hypothetical protein n=1 Tax=Neisseria weixii TaxID=1853276 RepID=UPI003624055B